MEILESFVSDTGLRLAFRPRIAETGPVDCHDGDSHTRHAERPDILTMNGGSYRLKQSAGRRVAATSDPAEQNQATA
jgi:hypothetical protein